MKSNKLSGTRERDSEIVCIDRRSSVTQLETCHHSTLVTINNLLYLKKSSSTMKQTNFGLLSEGMRWTGIDGWKLSLNR